MKIIFDQSDLRRGERTIALESVLWGLVIIANFAFILSVTLHSL